MRLAFLLPMLMLALTACGSTSALTKAQYAAKVSRLCVVAADQIRELHIDNSVSTWRHDGARVVQIAQHLVDSPGALRAPAEIADAAAAYLDVNEKALADGKAALEAAKAGDRVSLSAALLQASTDGRAGWPSAKAIGATGCYPG